MLNGISKLLQVQSVTQFIAAYDWISAARNGIDNDRFPHRALTPCFNPMLYPSFFLLTRGEMVFGRHPPEHWSPQWCHTRALLPNKFEQLVAVYGPSGRTRDQIAATCPFAPLEGLITYK